MDGLLLLVYQFHVFLYFLIFYWFYRLPLTFLVPGMFGNVYIRFYDFIQLFFKTLFFPPTLLSLYMPFLQFSYLYKTSVFSSIMSVFWYLLYSAVYCDSFSLGEVGGSCFKVGVVFPE